MRKAAVVTLAAAILLMVLLFVILPGRGSSDRVSVAFGTWVGFGAVFIAEEMGFYEDEGLDVSFQLIDEASARRAAIAAGQADIIGTTMDDVVVMASHGIPVQAFLAADESYGADGLITKTEVQSVSDLKGLQVAVQPGFVNHFFLLYLLETSGLDASEIQIQPMEPDVAGLAFLSGRVDAAVTWEPHLSAARARPDSHLLVSTKDPVARGLIVDVFVATPKFLRERPNAALGFVRGTLQGLDYWREEPASASQIIGSHLGLDAEIVNAIVADLRLLDLSQNQKYLAKSGQPESGRIVAARAAQIYQRQGIIGEVGDIEKLFDPGPVSKLNSGP